MFPVLPNVVIWNRVKALQNTMLINPLPNDNILDETKLKALADDKLNVAKLTISLFERVENIVRKGENARYKHFLLFQQCFPNHSSFRSLKVRIVW